MASKKGYSAGVGSRDLAYVMMAFQEMNSCILSLSIEMTVRTGRPDLVLKLTAYTIDAVTVERADLVSVQRTLSQLNSRSIEAAGMQLMYQADALLAAREFALVETK